MRAASTWVLVADGQRSRLFAHQGVGKGLIELDGEARERSVPPARELGSDRPGRAFESVGAKRHALEPRVDPHREEKAGFAREVAEQVSAAARDGRFDRLIIVAAPQTLGELRQRLDSVASSRIIGELPKDLTKAPVDRIAEQVGSVIAT